MIMEYHSNGKLYMKVFIIDDKIDGQVDKYYDNCILCESYFLINGEIDGFYYKYNKYDGKLLYKNKDGIIYKE